MFAKEINRMTLTNDVADRLFDNIIASSYGMDKTFAATLRALLHKRLPADETLALTLAPLDLYAITADLIAERITQNDKRRSHNIIIVFPQDKSFGTELLENVRSSIGEGKPYLNTYTIQEDLRVFYIRKLEGLFYTNG